MNKEQAEGLKLQIIERRNYFKQLEHPLTYSKSQMHSGMRGRTVRQADRSYMNDVKKRGIMASKNLQTIDNYLKDLNEYNNVPQQPSDGITIGTMSVKTAPTAPKINLTPKLQMRRKIRRGAGIY